jgi:hypothetical protein
MTDILPIFQAENFMFPEDRAPSHIEAEPIPTYVDLYHVFEILGGHSTQDVAVDIVTKRLAEKIAIARAEFQESTMKKYGYTTDIYIGFPDGQQERFYIGRSS